MVQGLVNRMHENNTDIFSPQVINHLAPCDISYFLRVKEHLSAKCIG